MTRTKKASASSSPPTARCCSPRAAITTGATASTSAGTGLGSELRWGPADRRAVRERRLLRRALHLLVQRHPVERATCTTQPVPSYTVVRIHLAVVSFLTGALDSNWAPLANPNTYAPYYYGCWTVFVSSEGDLYTGGLFKEIDSQGGIYPHAKLAVFPHLQPVTDRNDF